MPLFISGNKVLSAEALYQSLRFPSRPDIQRNIIAHRSPISAKNYARSVMEFNRPDWDQQRFRIMRFCIELKLYQNHDVFSKVLSDTQGFQIVEFTEKDKIWGAVVEGNNYIGTNALGRLLMELREKVVQNTFSLTIPMVNDFTFLGSPITPESIHRPNNHDRLF